MPSIDLVAPVTHVVLAFMRPELFISGTRPAEGWGAGFFVSSLSELRAKFPPETKVLIAIGGWGDSKGFEDAARDDESRRRWAAGVADMVDELMVEGVDVDWEYPGFVDLINQRGRRSPSLQEVNLVLTSSFYIGRVQR